MKKRELIWGIPVLIQLIYLIISEYKNYYIYMNSDIAADLLLASTMSKNGGWWIFCKDFYYTTEIHLLHTQLLQRMLFAFTDNYRLVFVISFAIFTILIVMCGFSLIYQITHSVKYSSIGAFLIMVPTGEYYVYCFRNQSFIAYVLFSYIHLYLYILLYNALGKGKQIILSLLIFVLTFLMGCCGLRFFSITILPIIACEVWTMFKNNLVTNKINIKMSSLYRMLLILLPALSGFGVFCTYIKKTFGPFGTTNAILNNGVDVLQHTSLGKAWGRLLEIHYLSIGMFAFFPLIIVLLKEIKINEVYRHACVVCFIAFVFVCNIGIYNRESGSVMKWVNVLMDNDFSFGYATNYWNGSYVTAMTNEKVEVVSFRTRCGWPYL